MSHHPLDIDLTPPSVDADLERYLISNFALLRQCRTQQIILSFDSPPMIPTGAETALATLSAPRVVLDSRGQWNGQVYTADVDHQLLVQQFGVFFTNPTGSRRIGISRNGAAMIVTDARLALTGISTVMNGMFFTDVVVGDTITPVAWQDSGGNVGCYMQCFFSTMSLTRA